MVGRPTSKSGTIIIQQWRSNHYGAGKLSIKLFYCMLFLFPFLLVYPAFGMWKRLICNRADRLKMNLVRLEMTRITFIT